METKRKGQQTPTKSVILPYKETHGEEAVELYNKTGNKAQEWQALLIENILAIDDDGIFTHSKFGYSVPRQNGKGEVLIIREMWGMVHGEKILHTAHRTTTTHSAWERLLGLLEKANIEIVSSYKAFGKEQIIIEGGGRIDFRTRTSKGGLGESFDLLIIDEAQEYTDDQESTLKYLTAARENPQTIFCGTPPTPISAGTVFTGLRNTALEGDSEYTGWEEWSVDRQEDVKNRDFWYMCNPSLGTILSERRIADEIGKDTVDFNIQRLGLWLRYNQKSAITEAEWDSLQCSKPPQLCGGLFIGIKYSHMLNTVSMAIACKTEDGQIFVECIDCRHVKDGNAWMYPFLANENVKRVIVDGANGQQLLSDEMKDLKLRAPILPTVKDIINANAAFERALYSGSICHSGQPSLRQAASNCEKRAIGSQGGFGYKSIRENVDISLLDSTILAHYACGTYKETRHKQRIIY